MYDAVGIVGSVAFVVLGWNIIYASGHFIFGRKADRRSVLFPLYIWIFIGALTGMITYFTVFGEIESSFTGMCIGAIVLSQLYDIENSAESTLSPSDRGGQAENRPLVGAASTYGGGAGRYRY